MLGTLAPVPPATCIRGTLTSGPFPMDLAGTTAPYIAGAGAEHHLDIYRRRDRSGPMPVVLYIHGGGFRLLSKETHWVMATILVRGVSSRS